MDCGGAAREDGDVPNPAEDQPEDAGQQRLRRAAAGALAATQAGDDDSAIEQLIAFVGGSPDSHAEARELLLLLFAACSRMVGALGAGGSVGVQMQVFDADGQELTIDEADPPVRTAIRTLLAEVHGDPAAARDQIEIALREATAAEMASVLLQALRWTIRLSDECIGRALPVPDWVSAALGE